MSKWILDSTLTARAYAIGSATNARVYAISSGAGFLMLDKSVKYGFNYNYASAYAIGSEQKVTMSINEQNTRILRDIEKITERALQEAWLTGYQQALKDMSNDLDVKANDNE